LKGKGHIVRGRAQEGGGSVGQGTMEHEKVIGPLH